LSEQFGLSASGLSELADTEAVVTSHSRLPLLSSGCFSQLITLRLKSDCLLCDETFCLSVDVHIDANAVDPTHAEVVAAKFIVNGAETSDRIGDIVMGSGRVIDAIAAAASRAAFKAAQLGNEFLMIE
jgi:hypothetical protein